MESTTKGIIYYTDNRLDEPLFSEVQARLLKANLPIVSVSLKPIDFGKNIVHHEKRGYLTMFKQVLKGLKASKADYIFMCEHDVLYNSSHFEFTPPRKDTYYYNNNCWKYNLLTGKCVSYDCHWLSQLCASREILINHYTKKIYKIKHGKHLWNWRFEPGTKKGIDNYGVEWFYSEHPNIDVRHGKNLTGMLRFNHEEFRDKKTCQNWQETTYEKLINSYTKSQ